MDKITLKKMLIAAAKGKGYESFSVGEVDSAVQNALKDYLGVTDRGMRRLSANDFAIVEEVIEELTPKAVEDIVGQFADVQTFDRGQQVIFNIRNHGKARVMRAIVPGARAGIYKARRLDNSQLHMVTQVETVGYALSLEDLLTGRVTIQDYVSLVTQGFVEVVYQRIIGALRTGALAASPANKAEVSLAGSAPSADISSGLDRVLRVVSAYGVPTIFAFETAAAQIANIAGSGLFPSNAYSGQDLQEVRDYGYIQKYKGRNIVVLPNFLTDNTNSKWLFDEDVMYVLPANEKPVKVAFAGQLYVQENLIPSGGVEFFAHREMGVALLANNSIGSIKLNA